MKIKDLPKTDRPREKLEKYGPGRLSDSELLAILLGSGIKGKNVLTLSGEIMRQVEKRGLPTFREMILVKSTVLVKLKSSRYWP